MIQAVLFDLEGTLVDVTAVDVYREKRDWSGYRANVGKTHLYAGVPEMLGRLADLKVRWAVVTNIVSNAAGALLKQHGLAPAARRCYHDVPPGHCKPHPAMCHSALEILGLDAQAAVGVGDTNSDCSAFRAARLPAYCAGWNALAETELGWSRVLKSPADVVAIVESSAS